jgi:SAM-dependent methyltransferase
MAHFYQQDFCTRVRSKHPQFFVGVNKEPLQILDIGSQDINGNNRFLFFNNFEYTGLDIGPGKNVDVVSTAHKFDPGKQYDLILSTEVLEHDKYWKESLLNTNRLLKSGGMMLITCASTGRPEHGTRRTDEFSSPLTAQAEGWEDYYMNITEADIKSVWDVEDIFAFHYFEYNAYSCDLYFYGIKK